MPRRRRLTTASNALAASRKSLEQESCAREERFVIEGKEVRPMPTAFVQAKQKKSTGLEGLQRPKSARGNHARRAFETQI